MPQYNTPVGSVAYPDSKSIFPSVRKVGFGQAIAIGIGAGVLGGVAMLTTQTLEQLLTGRPSSYVPAQTISTHLRISPSFYAQYEDALNHTHHFAMAMMAGPVRALMSYYGVVGPVASFLFTGVRIAMDQSWEIGAGVSTWPWRWPVNEQVVDLLHKGVYAGVVGCVADWGVRGVWWFG